MNATGNTGAASAADASQGSSPSPTNAQPAAGARPQGSLASRMAARVEQMSAGDAQQGAPEGAPQAGARPDLTQVDQRAPVDGELADNAQKAQADEAQKKPQPKMIPEAAFKQRLGIEADRTAKAKQEAHAARLEASQARAAAEILQRQLDEIRQAHADGVAFDPRDDELRIAKVTAEAKERQAQLKAEFEAEMKQVAEQAKATARREALREQLGNEVDAATAKFPGISRVELIARMTAAANRKQAASAEAIAKQLHDEFLVNARQVLGVSEQAQMPTTARAPGARSTTRMSNNTKGYEAFIKSFPG